MFDTVFNWIFGAYKHNFKEREIHRVQRCNCVTNFYILNQSSFIAK
jgi:hypothetical protein